MKGTVAQKGENVVSIDKIVGNKVFLHLHGPDIEPSSSRLRSEFNNAVSGTAGYVSSKKHRGCIVVTVNGNASGYVDDLRSVMQDAFKQTSLAAKPARPAVHHRPLVAQAPSARRATGIVRSAGPPNVSHDWDRFLDE